MKLFEEKKFCSKHLTRDLSMDSSCSFEVYYGNASVAVPFMWETRPGTPKANRYFPNTPPPPLTPPPSFQHQHPNKKNTTKNNKSKFLQSVLFLPRLNLKNKSSRLQSPSPTSSSSSSSSSSSPPSPWRRRSSSYSVPASPVTTTPRMSFDARVIRDDIRDHEDGYEEGSRSTPCFRVARGANPRNRAGCSANMVKLLFGEVHVMN